MLSPSRIRSLLNRRHPDWCVGNLVRAGRGLSATVYRGETAALGTIAVRALHQRWASSDNDPEAFDTRDALRQEAELARYMARFGVPVSAVHAVQFSNEADLLVTSFVEGDGRPVADEHLGELAARPRSVSLPGAAHRTDERGCASPRDDATARPYRDAVAPHGCCPLPTAPGCVARTVAGGHVTTMHAAYGSAPSKCDRPGRVAARAH